MSDTTQNENKGDWKNREVGALWLRTSAAGTKYLSGHVSLGAEDDLEERVVVFSNKDKKNDKAPDYRMYRSAPPQQATAAKTEENSSNDTEDDLDVL